MTRHTFFFLDSSSFGRILLTMFPFSIPSMRKRTGLLAQHNAMAAASFLFLIILAAAAVSSVDSTSTSYNGSCIPAERAALLSFKAGITSDPGNLLVSWRQTHHDCCRWSGVTCSSQTGRVVKLDLRSRSPAPEDFFADLEDYSLRGQVSSSLLALRHSLRHLDLSGNVVLGDTAAMPGFLGSLQSLTYLNLSRTGFHGRVPPQLGNISKLVQLDISNNGYGSLYSKDISWLTRLRSLEHLGMGSIDLSAVVDWVHTFNALPNLVVLNLPFCRLIAPASLPHHNLTVLEELNLSYNFNTQFNKNTNPSVNSLAAAAPNWLWDITSLRSLSLWHCGFSGTFPDGLGNLTLLETFDISHNNFKGMIPGTVQHMCNLRSVGLGGNNIGRDITEVIHKIPNCTWKNLQELNLVDTNLTSTTLQFVSNLISLRMLDISHNQLSGSVPMEIGMLTHLTRLYLDENKLSGSLPVEIGRLADLTELYLGNNYLSGSLHAEIGRLKKLSDLDLRNNSLSGVISQDHFTDLINLKFIDLSYNNLELTIDSHWVPPFNLDSAWFTSCHLGPQIPKWLRWQKGTMELDISNTSLVGRIPDWFWTTFSDATYLDISLNQLSGDLPLSLEFMSVIALAMQSNLLTGLIPKLPRTVEVLDISKNSLNGFVPNFQAPNLQFLVLFSNSITRIPTSICRLRKLQVLDLSNNLLSGELPDCRREALKQWNPFSNNSSRVNTFSLQITTLLLSNNSLSSKFPLFLQQCPKLIFLDLTQNKFTGELPGWISEAMPDLVMLRLRSNNFSGHIPSEMMELHNVCILDLSNNNFSGAIPRYLQNLKALTDTGTNDNVNPFEELYKDKYGFLEMIQSNDSFSVVIKGQVLQYGKNTIYLMSIDLSCNGLSGEIPEELSSLTGLINLNLSSNLLSGNVPYKIGNLRSLESLDLSKNKLGGGIPQTISDLTYLSYLNLSYNNLSGRIPSGHQLDSLNTDDPASMYIGNPFLCGHPIPRQCPGPPGDSPANGDPARWSEDGLSGMDFLLGSIIGFVVGAWMVFCGLLFIKRWRYSYFVLLDKLYDKLYVISVVTWRKWYRNTDVN